MVEKKEGKAQTLKRDLDRELDLLEGRIAELRMLFEQHFADVLPLPPAKLQKEVLVMMKRLLRAPFKNSASRFRLRMLIQRYQTYATYWERVLKQKEEGTYSKDLFKADMRERAVEDAKLQSTAAGAAEKGMKQLFDSYEAAIKKQGGSTANLSFDSFKKSLVQKAKLLKEKHGMTKLRYKVVVKDGKVVVKASAK